MLNKCQDKLTGLRREEIEDIENEEEIPSLKTETFLSNSLSEDIDKKRKRDNKLENNKDDLSFTNSLPEYSDLDKNSKFYYGEDDDLAHYCKQLKEKIHSKNQYIKKMKAVLESDDKMKGDMMLKIKELREKIKSMKEKINDANNFDDEEINELLENLDNKSILNMDTKADDVGVTIANENKMTQNYIGISGNALMNDYQTRIYLTNSKTRWGRFKILLGKIFSFFVPFKSELKYLFARYDRNVSGMFEFLRFLFIFNVLILFTASYMLINHLVTYEQRKDSMLCKFYLPCRIFYSRFSELDKMTYSFTFIAICVVLFIGLIIYWTDYKRHNLLQTLFDSDSLLYSKLVFNLWDWNVNNTNSKLDTTTRLKNIFTIGVSETIIKENIMKRSSAVKARLLMRRILSFFLSILILGFDIFCVVSLYLLQAYLMFIDSDKEKTSVTDILVSFLPGVGLAVLNMIIPKLFELCVSLEKWDFNSTKLVQLLWRIYIAKLFTQGVVYAFLIMFLILGLSPQEIFQISSFDFNFDLKCPGTSKLITATATDILAKSKLIEYTNYTNCKEDQFSMNLLLNLIIGFFSNKIIALGMFLFRYIYNYKIKKTANYKSKFNVINSATDVLMLNIQIYVLFPFFPYIFFLSPILIYLQFKIEFWYLKFLYSKPDKLSLQNKTGYFLMTLFTFTMIGLIIVFILYFTNGISHTGYLQCYTGDAYYYLINSGRNCGPFKDKEPPKTIVYQTLEKNSSLFVIYEVMANPLYIFIASFLLIAIIIYSFKVSSALFFYIKNKKKENKASESTKNEIIKKMREQIKFLKFNLNERKNISAAN